MMNKNELDQSLNFLLQPEDHIAIIVYGLIKDQLEPVKLDIKDDDLPPIKKMFIKSVKSQILDQTDFSILPLSTADERGKCFYEYDLDIPQELAFLTEVIGDDSLETFNFNQESIIDITALIILLSADGNTVSLYKELSPIEVIGRGGYLLKRAGERFERFDDKLLRISGGFQVLAVSGGLIILKLTMLERSFGFSDIITREASLGVQAIEELTILENIDTLKELISEISFARKLTKISKSSPVLRLGITNQQIIEFSKSHPATRGKIRYNGDGSKIALDTKVSKDLFIKILNDDYLTSELTKVHYDSLAKDDILMEGDDSIIVIAQ